MYPYIYIHIYIYPYSWIYDNLFLWEYKPCFEPYKNSVFQSYIYNITTERKKQHF